MATKKAEEQSPERTTEQLANKAHEAVDRIAETAAPAEDKLREQAASADERAREAAGRGQEQADAALKTVTNYVRENPLLSMGLAFAAGAIYSSYMRRR